MTQVYLPYSDFSLVAKCLDNRRLNCQLKEAVQVYTANKYGFGGQGNPAPYKMWLGYETALLWYVVEAYKEWQLRLVNGKRGGKLSHKSGDFVLSEINGGYSLEHCDMPHWIDDERIFSSYRSALLYKDYDWYSKFGWSEKPSAPVKIDKKGNVTLPYFYGF